MSTKVEFDKFPSTPYLTMLESISIRNDKIMSLVDCEAFLSNTLIVEEKIDGANLGISFDAEGNILLQNRGGYVFESLRPQWRKLPNWLEPKMDLLFDLLTDRYILFGEWCYAQHSIVYNKLPDWFIGFDIYDKLDKRFLSVQFRNNMFRVLGVSSVPKLGEGVFSIDTLTNLFSQSKFGDFLAEGVYLRYDKGNWLEQRAKLVRPKFIQSIETHWSRGQLKKNRLGRKENEDV